MFCTSFFMLVPSGWLKPRSLSVVEAQRADFFILCIPCVGW